MRAYRGYTIIQVGDHWEVRRGDFLVTKCATSWGAICYIDELLSP